MSTTGGEAGGGVDLQEEAMRATARARMVYFIVWCLVVVVVIWTPCLPPKQQAEALPRLSRSLIIANSVFDSMRFITGKDRAAHRLMQVQVPATVSGSGSSCVATPLFNAIPWPAIAGF